MSIRVTVGSKFVGFLIFKFLDATLVLATAWTAAIYKKILQYHYKDY